MIKAQSAKLPAQKAIFQKLDGQLMSAITNAVVPVYDCPQSGGPFPYVVIGETFGSSAKTKTGWGESITFTIHIFSDYKGDQEADQIMGDIMDILTNDYLDLSDDEFNHWYLDIPFFQTFKDETGTSDGGEKFHSVVRFELGIQKL